MKRYLIPASIIILAAILWFGRPPAEPLRTEQYSDANRYHNAEFGFSFEYPKNWTLQEDNGRLILRDAQSAREWDIGVFFASRSFVHEEGKTSDIHMVATPRMNFLVFLEGEEIRVYETARGGKFYQVRIEEKRTEVRPVLENLLKSWRFDQ
jgi:hypothetical protein